LALIDAGLPGSHKKILRYLSGLGYARGDLKRILITHADFDHVGGLAALKAASGARVYASAVEAQAIQAGHSSRALKPRSPIRQNCSSISWLVSSSLPPSRSDELLTDGQVLPVLDGLQVVETLGHTPGHVSFYAPSAGVLFCR